MEKIVYKDMIQQEKEHWWFKGRREILETVLNKIQLPPNASILEVGCGTGGNIEMLKRYGKVEALEMDSFAVSVAKKHDIVVYTGSVPDNFHIETKYDLICLFDVLEHIENDFYSIESLSKNLKPAGKIFITVPAHQWLFGKHDTMLHHYRRYSKSRLLEIASESNINIECIFSFNTILFPLLIISRLLDKFRKNKIASGYKTPNIFINKLLYNIFRSEKIFLKNGRFRVGASMAVILSGKVKNIENG